MPRYSYHIKGRKEGGKDGRKGGRKEEAEKGNYSHFTIYMHIYAHHVVQVKYILKMLKEWKMPHNRSIEINFLNFF